ncbi:unnamed protein product, partial [Didymodactylos carnosus]
ATAAMQHAASTTDKSTHDIVASGVAQLSTQAISSLPDLRNRVRVACCFGILEHWYPIEQLISLSAVPQELVDLKTDGMKNISMITASKLYVRGATNGVTCSCKGGCKNKQRACKKTGVFCSTKCHKSNASCQNQEN